MCWGWGGVSGQPPSMESMEGGTPGGSPLTHREQLLQHSGLRLLAQQSIYKFSFMVAPLTSAANA